MTSWESDSDPTYACRSWRVMFSSLPGDSVNPAARMPPLFVPPNILLLMLQDWPGASLLLRAAQLAARDGAAAVAGLLPPLAAAGFGTDPRAGAVRAVAAERGRCFLAAPLPEPAASCPEILPLLGRLPRFCSKALSVAALIML